MAELHKLFKHMQWAAVQQKVGTGRGKWESGEKYFQIYLLSGLWIGDEGEEENQNNKEAALHGLKISTKIEGGVLIS